MYVYQNLWEDYIKDSEKLDLKSLVPKETLNPDLWEDEDTLKKEILDKLLKVANDFFENLGLDTDLIDDITITGSSASYNWSSYSDVDLHILVSFKKVNKNEELVQEYFRGKIFVWNNKHKILINDHEVEIYVQDTDEPHHSEGVFSLKNNRWDKKPVKKEVNIDFNGVKKKAMGLIDHIERVEDLFEDKNYSEAFKNGKNIKLKIKNMRSLGLDRAGIYSIENLAFKILRRTGYICLLSDLIDNSYDMIHSIGQNFNNLVKKINVFVSKDKKGFFDIKEEEIFQKRMKKRHFRMKKRLLSRGKQKNLPPFDKKPNYNRSKSAPPRFGGS